MPFSTFSHRHVGFSTIAAEYIHWFAWSWTMSLLFRTKCVFHCFVFVFILVIVSQKCAQRPCHPRHTCSLVTFYISVKESWCSRRHVCVCVSVRVCSAMRKYIRTPSLYNSVDFVTIMFKQVGHTKNTDTSNAAWGGRRLRVQRALTSFGRSQHTRLDVFCIELKLDRFHFCMGIVRVCTLFKMLIT